MNALEGHVPSIEPDECVTPRKEAVGLCWVALCSCGELTGNSAMTHGQAETAIGKHIAKIERRVGLR